MDPESGKAVGTIAYSNNIPKVILQKRLWICGSMGDLLEVRVNRNGARGGIERHYRDLTITPWYFSLSCLLQHLPADRICDSSACLLWSTDPSLSVLSTNWATCHSPNTSATFCLSYIFSLWSLFLKWLPHFSTRVNSDIPLRTQISNATFFTKHCSCPWGSN